MSEDEKGWILQLRLSPVAADEIEAAEADVLRALVGKGYAVQKADRFQLTPSGAYRAKILRGPVS